MNHTHYVTANLPTWSVKTNFWGLAMTFKWWSGETVERHSDGRCGRLQHGGGGNDQRRHSNRRKAQGTTITTNYALYCTVPEILAIFIHIQSGHDVTSGIHNTSRMEGIMVMWHSVYHSLTLHRFWECPLLSMVWRWKNLQTWMLTSSRCKTGL